MALDRDFALIDGANARRERFFNNSGAALNEGDGFFITSGSVTVLADTNIVGIWGICCGDVADDAYGECYVEGLFKVDVSGTLDFAQGEAVYNASASTVDKGATSDIPIGHVATANPASGAATVIISINSQILDRTAHA